MVSLQRSINSTTEGATFFSDSVTMDDREYLQPILESYGMFKPLKTIPAFSFHLLFAISLEIAAIIFACLHPIEEKKCETYFIIIYCHIALWFVTLIVDQIARNRHHKLRINGYLDFYKKTLVHHRLPLYVVSLWNATILLIQTLMQHFYPDNFAEKCVKDGVLKPINYVCAIIGLEVCLLAGININYIVKVYRFNKTKPPPDVQKEEWQSVSTPDTFAQGEVGYRQHGDRIFDLIEKQADLIRYLKEHNDRLGEKLMVLNAQMRARGRNN